MNPISSKKDRERFLKALMLWDRPENQFGGTPFAEDTDTDAFVDRIFSAPSAGLLRD